MTRAISILGTGSDVGKSIIVAGLCRYFANQGLKVAPFKGQNMALNSYVTSDGSEIGRAQAFQAFAANIEPTAELNPVLLKPSSRGKSQVMVKGSIMGELTATQYYSNKNQLVDTVDDSLENLLGKFDLVILEGAGSPAEINLPGPDLANLGLCKRHNINAVIVGDIEKGGVIASLVGTTQVVDRSESRYLKGFIINKFRGDNSLFDGGLNIIENITGMMRLGILEKLDITPIELEDSYSLNNYEPQTFNRPYLSFERGSRLHDRKQHILKVGVVKFPHMSNFSDLDPLRLETSVNVLISSNLFELAECDMLILPGTKSTVSDMMWFKKHGGDLLLTEFVKSNRVVMGICGGYQMLSRVIFDPVESQVGRLSGFGYLNATTEFQNEKFLCQHRGIAHLMDCELPIRGYQIQNGIVSSVDPWITVGNDNNPSEGSVSSDGLVYGISWHGIFENDEFRYIFLEKASRLANKDVAFDRYGYDRAKNDYVDKISEAISKSIAVDMIFNLSSIG